MNSFFDSSFLLKQLYTIFNLFTVFLYKNYNFFIFNFDFLINDVYAFAKWVYGVKTIYKYNFIFKSNLKNFRNYKWKRKLNLFIKKKRVKITFLLDIYNNSFFVDFLKNSKVITIGLIPQNQTFLKLDFWCISNTNTYLVKYLFFSYIYSIYNTILSIKMFSFFLKYSAYFQKCLSKLS